MSIAQDIIESVNSTKCIQDAEYVIMHRNDEVIKFVLNDTNVTKSEIINKELIPPYLNIDKDLFQMKC